MSNITRKRLKKVLHYDPKTGVWTWLVKLNNRYPSGTRAGYINKGYRVIGIDGIKYKSSRLAWLYMKGVWPKFEVDHEDTDKSNDRWKNLRDATSSQNRWNTKKQKNNKSGYKGVHGKSKHWHAQIQVKGNHINLGCRSTPEAAHALYIAASKKYFGEFARS